MSDSFLVSIFCYGQTGSGKTYTMYGTGRDNPGIVQLSVGKIFAFIQTTADREFLLRLSYIEIYNESVNDLLSSDKKNLQMLDQAKARLVVSVTRRLEPKSRT